MALSKAPAANIVKIMIAAKLLGRLRAGFANDRPPAQRLPDPVCYVDPASLLAPSALLRLGTEYGGWTIPADHGLGPDSVCYMAGAGEDISFDCEIARRFGSRVTVLDPTPRAIAHFEQLCRAVQAGQAFPINGSDTAFYTIGPADLARMRFLPFGLFDADLEQKFYLPRNPAHVSCSTANLQGTEDYFTAQCHTLRSIMNGQADARVDLVKMDIEGAEYAVIGDLVTSGPLPRLLLVEFDEIHSPQDADAPARIKRHIDMLAGAGMRCFSIDGCNFSFMRAAPPTPVHA